MTTFCARRREGRASSSGTPRNQCYRASESKCAKSLPIWPAESSSLQRDHTATHRAPGAAFAVVDMRIVARPARPELPSAFAVRFLRAARIWTRMAASLTRSTIWVGATPVEGRGVHVILLTNVHWLATCATRLAGLLPRAADVGLRACMALKLAARSAEGA